MTLLLANVEVIVGIVIIVVGVDIGDAEPMPLY